MPSYTVNDIAEKIRGQIFGNASTNLSGIKPLEFATESDISFLAASSEKQHSNMLELAREKSIGVLLIRSYDPLIKTTQIITSNPMASIIELIPLFYHSPELDPGIHPTAIVAKNAIIGSGTKIGAYAVIGENTIIGQNSVIHPHVVLYPGSKIGDNCLLHSGAVIREFVHLGNDCIINNGVIVGSDGFGFISNVMGHQRIPHIGTVVIEDGVDIGANTTIDRGTLGETRIKQGTKIDNLVMIGHNVEIGSQSLLCGQVGISGSSRIGNKVTLAGQVGVADHSVIGDNVRASAKSGIYGVVESNSDVGGFPFLKFNEWKRQAALLTRLQELFKRVRQLEKRFGVISSNE